VTFPSLFPGDDGQFASEAKVSKVVIDAAGFANRRQTSLARNVRSHPSARPAREQNSSAWVQELREKLEC
jgi:hypothetical protein